MRCKLRVKKVEKWDLWKGWVRINKGDRKNINRKDICKIEVESTGEGVYRQIIGTNKGTGIIQMDFDTRAELNVSLEKEYSFLIEKSSWWNLFGFYYNHPDLAIKIAFRMGIFSIIIAIVALIISLFQ